MSNALPHPPVGFLGFLITQAKDAKAADRQAMPRGTRGTMIPVSSSWSPKRTARRKACAICIQLGEPPFPRRTQATSL